MAPGSIPSLQVTRYSYSSPGIPLDPKVFLCLQVISPASKLPSILIALSRNNMFRGGKTSWYNKLMTLFAHCIHTVEHHAIAYSSVSPGCVTFVCVFLFMCMCMRVSAITIYIWARAYIVNPIVLIRGCCHTTQHKHAG